MSQLFIGKGNLGSSPSLRTLKGGPNGEFDVASMRVRFSRYGRTEEGGIEEVGGFWREVEIYGAKARDAAKGAVKSEGGKKAEAKPKKPGNGG